MEIIKGSVQCFSSNDTIINVAVVSYAPERTNWDHDSRQRTRQEDYDMENGNRQFTAVIVALVFGGSLPGKVSWAVN